jgi:hypothetical protein
MTKSELETLARTLARGVHQTIEQALDPLKRELGELRCQRDLDAARVRELQARPSIAYCGVWKEGATYNEGSLVTRAGSLWCAVQQTAMKPGSDPSWRLIVKAGQA